jgi:hypothetical protein
MEFVEETSEINITSLKGKCLHGRRKYFCVECNGGGICSHYKRKSSCKECHGISICLHGRIKSRCKECGGSEICSHNRMKSFCKLCGGNQICEHNRVKSICKECKGSQICEHNRVKSICKECKGSQICEHNREKSTCKECKGSQICEHNKIKTQCKECKGSQICEHNRHKSTCKECKGSQICEHNKRKYYCKICDGKNLCKTELCETKKNNKYEGYCFPCFVNNPENIDKPIFRNYKTKERAVVDSVKEVFTNVTWIHDKKIQDGCSLRRPDLLLDMGSHVIIIEIDENKHTDYDCSCENKRLMQLSLDLNHRPIVFIRFNPDDYLNEDGILIKSCWKINKLGVMQIMKTKQKEWQNRIDCLLQQIKYWIDNSTEKTVEIIELFY